MEKVHQQRVAAAACFSPEVSSSQSYGINRTERGASREPVHGSADREVWPISPSGTLDHSPDIPSVPSPCVTPPTGSTGQTPRSVVGSSTGKASQSRVNSRPAKLSPSTHHSPSEEKASPFAECSPPLKVTGRPKLRDSLLPPRAVPRVRGGARRSEEVRVCASIHDGVRGESETTNAAAGCGCFRPTKRKKSHWNHFAAFSNEKQIRFLLRRVAC